MDRWLGKYSELFYTVMRVVVGLLFVCHGAQKLFGVLGASRASTPLHLTAGIIEFVGGGLVAVGLWAGSAAFIASGTMAVAYFMTAAPRGFWPIVNRGELAVLYCFVFLYIASKGAGTLGRKKGGPLQDQWTAVDRYITDLLVPSDSALDGALEASTGAGLPAINVSASQGKWLYLMAKVMGARNILEIGTLGGYSTIWLARALPPGGRLVTLEVDAVHAEVARRNFARAGLADVIELRHGPALDTLPTLAAEGADPFDMIFIDADKPSYADYLAWAVRLSRSGSLIVADNVVRDGAVIDANSQDPAVQGMRRFNAALAAEPRVTATQIQTVGVKGYDGFAVIVVTTS